MALPPDLLVDRRRLKRRLVLWRVVAVVAVVALGLGLVRTMLPGGLDVTARPYVAHVEVEGLITEDRPLLELIDRLGEDARVRAIMVRINSPGGTVVGGEALYAALHRASLEKPVVAVMGTTAASAAYMAALGADRIYAHAGTITGSIGVLAQITHLHGLLDKLGVEVEAVRSAPYKAVPSPLEPMTEEGREVTRDLVSEMYDLFLALVAERRGFDAETMREIGQGRPYTGRRALELGLIDELGDETTARAWLVSEHGIGRDLELREVEPRRDRAIVDRLVAATFGKSLLSERLMLDGLVSVWHPDLSVGAR